MFLACSGGQTECCTALVLLPSAQDGKPMLDYLAGWREGVATLLLAPEVNLMMEHSQSTLAFYWSAGVKSHM